MAIQGFVIPAYAAYRLRSRFVPVLRPFAALGLLGSVLSVAAYALVLWAQTRAELAIAALRESSVNLRSCSNNFAGQGAGEAIPYAPASSRAMRARLRSTFSLAPVGVGDVLNPA
jgi:hypothetical protein